METIRTPTADLLDLWRRLPIPPKIRQHFEVEAITASSAENDLQLRAKLRGPFGIPIKIEIAVELSVPTPTILQILLKQADVEGISAKDLITKALLPIFAGLTEVEPHTLHYPLDQLPKSLKAHSIVMVDSPNAVDLLLELDPLALIPAALPPLGGTLHV